MTGKMCLESMRFSCETPNMRKRIINAAQPDPPQTCEWLNVEEIAQVEVSSEDPQYPIESAFKRGKSLGWRASQPGEQTIRLLFDWSRSFPKPVKARTAILH